jgi:hypothetical protein
MTTNIFDKNSAVMATDSRWSIEYGQWILYLDDTGYEKIERCNGVALMFAGLGPKIQEYKDWIRSKPTDFSLMPDVKGMAVCMVHEASNNVTFRKHQDIEANNVYCAGSGARPAYSCWLDNKCSKTAVESAKLKDHYSGGEVKYVNFGTSETNLHAVFPQVQMTIQTITDNIIQRGIAMQIHATPTGTPDLKLAKASSGVVNDEQAARAEMASLVAQGKLSATAPCDGMHSDWSEEDKTAFRAALAQMFGWEK